MPLSSTHLYTVVPAYATEHAIEIKVNRIPRIGNQHSPKRRAGQKWLAAPVRCIWPGGKKRGFCPGLPIAKRHLRCFLSGGKKRGFCPPTPSPRPHAPPGARM